MSTEASAKHTPTVSRDHPAGMGGTQTLYRFANGYGASVVQFRGSYGYEGGLWELAVLRYEGADADHFRLDYTTPITDDVIGHLTPAEVDEHLDRIAALADTGASA